MNSFIEENKVIILAVLLLLAVVIVYTMSKKSGFGATDPNEGKTLILYRPGCGYCDAAMPEFKKAEGGDIKLMESSKNPDLMDKYNLEGVPSIIKIKNGNAIPFEGKRTANEIIEFSK
jgi:thiol-disulfide isomerase/thioredoxin